MAMIIVYGIPAHGHTNPTLPLIKELCAKGEKVFYYSTPLFEKSITESGAEYRKYPHLENFDTIAAGKNLALLYFMIADATERMLSELLSEISEIKPSYIIHDALAMWGRHVASITRISAVTLVTTFAYSKKNMKLTNTLKFIRKVGWSGIQKMRESRKIQVGLFNKYGTRPLYFIDSMMNEERLNIVFCSHTFQPHAEYYDERYHFVGPSIEKRINDSDTTDYANLKKPLIYISMGTIWSGHFDLPLMIGAMEPFNGTIVFSYKNPEDTVQKNERVIIKEHVNQLEILKYADLFITHGGMNSVNEGLYNGVPLCIYPFQAEQDEVADRVVELGCGLRLRKMEVDEIRRAVKKILNNASYAENCREISTSLKEAGGYKRAAEIILSYGNDSQSIS